jgi:biopolymer transport protein ExbD
MAMQTGPQKEGEPHSEINTTPLIDVMLVLLVMLIVTLPPQLHGMTIDTPQQSEPPITPPPPPIRIAVDYDGSMLWNGVQVTSIELDRRLSVEAHRPEKPEIHIEPHRLAKYGDVAHVMAAAERQGLTRLGVAGGA